MGMIKQLKNIDTAFKLVKRFAILIIVASFVTVILSIWYSHTAVQKAYSRVYLIANDKIIEAVASQRDAQIDVEAKNHLHMFHTYFFTLSPDERQIHKQITRSLYLADRSAKRGYDNLKEKGFYSQLIAGNISQEIETDSIAVDIYRHPYHFTYYGKQRIIRSTSLVVRSLITTGRLREVQRSDHNPHGFLIENWETIENKDINITTR